MIRVLEQDLELMPYPSPWGSGRWSYSGIPPLPRESFRVVLIKK